MKILNQEQLNALFESKKLDMLKLAQQLQQLETNPEKLEQVMKILSPKEEKPAFPTRPVSDPVRRGKKISKQHDDAFERNTRYWIEAFGSQNVIPKLGLKSNIRMIQAR